MPHPLSRLSIDTEAHQDPIHEHFFCCCEKDCQGTIHGVVGLRASCGFCGRRSRSVFLPLGGVRIRTFTRKLPPPPSGDTTRHGTPRRWNGDRIVSVKTDPYGPDEEATSYVSLSLQTSVCVCLQ